MECQRCSKVFSSTAAVQEHLNTHFLEPDDAPLLPSGKHSILKKRLLKRRNIKDLSAELQPRFFVGFVRHDNDVITDMKEPPLQQEIEVETNEKESFSGDHYSESYNSEKGDLYSTTSDTGGHDNDTGLHGNNAACHSNDTGCHDNDAASHSNENFPATSSSGLLHAEYSETSDNHGERYSVRNREGSCHGNDKGCHSDISGCHGNPRYLDNTESVCHVKEKYSSQHTDYHRQEELFSDRDQPTFSPSDRDQQTFSPSEISDYSGNVK